MNQRLKEAIGVVFLIGLFVIIGVLMVTKFDSPPTSGWPDSFVQEFNWEPVAPPAPGMECWTAVWRGAVVAVCR